MAQKHLLEQVFEVRILFSERKKKKRKRKKWFSLRDVRQSCATESQILLRLLCFKNTPSVLSTSSSVHIS